MHSAASLTEHRLGHHRNCGVRVSWVLPQQETLAKEAAGQSGGVARLNNMLMQMRSVARRCC